MAELGFSCFRFPIGRVKSRTLFPGPISPVLVELWCCFVSKPGALGSVPPHTLRISLVANITRLTTLALVFASNEYQHLTSWLISATPLRIFPLSLLCVCACVFVCTRARTRSGLFVLSLRRTSHRKTSSFALVKFYSFQPFLTHTLTHLPKTWRPTNCASLDSPPLRTRTLHMQRYAGRVPCGPKTYTPQGMMIPARRLLCWENKRSNLIHDTIAND